MNDIIAILSSEDREEVKCAIKNLIVNRVEKDFEEYNMYCFNPDYIEDLVQQSFDEIMEDLKPKFKKAVKDKMTALIDTMQLPKDYK